MRRRSAEREQRGLHWCGPATGRETKETSFAAERPLVSLDVVYGASQSRRVVAVPRRLTSLGPERLRWVEPETADHGQRGRRDRDAEESQRREQMNHWVERAHSVEQRA